MRGGFIYLFPNSHGCTVDVWDWISSFIPHFIMDLITYPCWGKSWTMLLKSAPRKVIWPFNSRKELMLIYLQSYLQSNLTYIDTRYFLQFCSYYWWCSIIFLYIGNRWNGSNVFSQESTTDLINRSNINRARFLCYTRAIVVKLLAIYTQLRYSFHWNAALHVCFQQTTAHKFHSKRNTLCFQSIV